jgi:Histidine kinase-, DNA gyrase B-, and HSP90-like ATPase
MLLDIRGRIRNVNLPTSRPLMPLFEAVVNSIQAIEESGREGTIYIRIMRDQSPTLIDIDKSSRDIVGFEIEDDGIGFNEDNFKAFSTSDTTYKADKGGKGVGRFAWLVAFEEVDIESTFEASGGFEIRRFKFVPRGDGLEENEVSEAHDQRVRTIVR